MSSVPDKFRPLSHFVRTAQDYAVRDPVVQYWALLHAVQTGMGIDRKSPDCVQYLGVLLGQLEQVKQANKTNEAITNETVAQAQVEQEAFRLFNFADQEDRAAKFNKNVVKIFFTSSLLFDVLAVFGPIDEMAQHSSKYAKWKATYIHNCLKNGIMPQPGPLGADEFGEGQDACPAFPNFDPYSGGAGLTGGDAMGGAGASSSNQHPFAPDPGQSSAFAPQPPPIPQPTYQPAYVPPTTPMQNLNISAPGGGPAAALTPQQTVKAQKYCKYASSALEYDDVPEAIANLRKALILLETGVDS